VGAIGDREAGTRAGGLTAREREVLGALVRGLTNDEIAGELGISVNTVERHASSIYRKLDVPGRAGAVAWAFRNGVAPPD
jgi:DNA-binding NarL/FixJ family response regulator